MDIDLRVGPERTLAEYGSFTYFVSSKGNEIAFVYLYGGKAPCGESLTVLDYIHVLEHEYVELSCAKIAYEDGHRKWNGDGFNDIAKRSKKLHG